MEEIIAQSGPWRVIDRHKGNDEWRNIRVEKRGKSSRWTKRVWTFGWNGERVAEAHDAIRLRVDWPDIYDWVISELRR
jgi:hypothetical protein